MTGRARPDDAARCDDSFFFSFVQDLAKCLPQAHTVSLTSLSLSLPQVFNDPVHGHFYLSALECAVVDTPPFQRLRDRKQLGVSYYVFPGACHNRFEHSLGVAHLARGAAERVFRLQRREVDVDRGDVKAVALAGLCHDLGHGPFSHVFERELLPRAGVHGWRHEDMSVRVFDAILDSGAIRDGELTNDEAARVRAMILAGHHDADARPRPPDGQRWLHEIVANGRNGLDVDKFDYLQRDAACTGVRIAADFDRLAAFSKVIGDETCYKWSEYQNVHEVFRARASLHQRVYNHRKAKAVEFMVVDALAAAEPVLRLGPRATSGPGAFLALDDTLLKQVEHWQALRPDWEQGAESADVAAIAAAQAILGRLRRRDLYRFVDEFVVPAGEAGRFSLPTPEDVACTGTSGDGPGPGTAAAPASAAAAGASGTNLADLIICEIPIDLTAGAAWPLDRVSFFHHAHSTTKFRMRKDEVSAMLPDVCQERRVRAYCRNSDPAAVGAAAAAFAAWRARRFGGKVGSSTPIRAPRPGTVPSSSGGDRAAEAHPAFDVAQETLKRRRLDMDAAAGAQ